MVVSLNVAWLRVGGRGGGLGAGGKGQGRRRGRRRGGGGVGRFVSVCRCPMWMEGRSGDVARARPRGGFRSAARIACCNVVATARWWWWWRVLEEEEVVVAEGLGGSWCESWQCGGASGVLQLAVPA